MKKSYTLMKSAVPAVMKKRKLPANLLKGFAMLLVIATCLMPKTSQAQANYYLRLDTVNASGAAVRVRPNNVRAWTVNVDGSKGATPKNFTTDGQIFNIQANGFSLATNWTVSGLGSKIVVGAVDSTIAFTCNATSNITGTVDVLDKATFNYQGAITDNIVFGNLATGSTVRYSGNTSVVQNVLSYNYYNLSLGAGGNTYPVRLPSLVGVAGVFSSRQSFQEGSTIDFNGNGGQAIPAGNYYNITNTGVKAIPDTLKGAVFVAGEYKPVNTVVAAAGSTLNFNGTASQMVASPYKLNNLTFSSGLPYFVTAFDHAASTITIVKPSTLLSVGQKISAVAGGAVGPTLSLDTSTTITSITDDTILHVSTAPKIRILINAFNHAPGKTDTIYITYVPFTANTTTITLQDVPTFAIGDTLAGALFSSATLVKTITGNDVTVSKAILNNYFGVVNFGSSDRTASDKTITGKITLAGALNVGNANVTTTGSTIEYAGVNGNAAATNTKFVYDNLTINLASGNINASGPISVNGALKLLSGRINSLVGTSSRLITLGENATIEATNDTTYVNGPLAKKFASTNSFVFPIGKGGFRKDLLLIPKTTDVKTYTAQYFAIADSLSTLNAPLVGVDSTFYSLSVSAGAGNDSSAAQIGLSLNNVSATTPADLRVAYTTSNRTTSKWILIGKNPSLATAGFIVSDSLFKSFNKNNSATFFTIASTSEPLPVKLVAFSGKKSAGGITLTWSTSAEINSATFIVERKIDGGSFAPVATVKAQGTSSISTNYTTTDKNLIAGVTTYYYRLAQVDKDGKVSYSPAVVVKIDGGLTLGLISIYPNPAHNTLHATIGAATDTKVSLIITDLAGKVLKQTVKSVVKGSNLISLDIASLKAGTYLLTALTTNNEKTVSKFVVY